MVYTFYLIKQRGQEEHRDKNNNKLFVVALFGCRGNTTVFGCLLVVYLLFFLAFGNIIQNSYVYISGVSAFTGIELTPDIRLTYFLIYAASGMTFSPIGEEFMYRGVIHGCFVPRFGENKASVIDSLAFAFTHLAHFGIVYVSGVWQFLPIPACMWIVSMFVVSRCFFVCKKKSDSLLGAILSHAAFNITNVLLCRK